MGEVRAGAAVVDITPGAGVPMGGYGARVGVAEAQHDPLHVRTVVIADGDSEIAVCVCDLLGVGRDLVGAARALIEAQSGLPPDHVVVAATHTHSGPAGFRTSDAADYVGVTAQKIAGSVRVARQRLQPVSLKVGTAEVASISQNRRHPDGPAQRTATVLLAAPEGGGAAVATIVNFACHSTVLEHDNLAYSADFPGAMARAVERGVGGVAVYLQGAAGDINPVWMRHDHAEVERVGGILGAAAVRTVHELRPVGEEQWCINLSWSENVPHPAAPGTRLTGVRLAGRRARLVLPRRSRRSPDDIAAEIERLTAARAAVPDADVGEIRRLTARLNELGVAHLLSRAGAGRPTQELEVQALRIADQCALVTLPGEFFVETGFAIAAGAGIEHLLVAGYANGSVGYVPTAAAFPEAGYEVGMTQFGPDAAGAVADAAVATVRSLYE